ncbi:MAG: GC-type dockerin domain-anchored protein [Planctomycetota bacterium]|nr:GC-type dockerin domain-anchored protein [Planctomycetota bacterium]
MREGDTTSTGRSAVIFAVAWALLAGSTASANIDLEWRAEDAVVEVGETARVGLYAVWDGGEHDSFSAMDVIFAWDPQHLQFQGIDDTGGVELLRSEVPYPHPSGLNEADPPQDGDGLYIAWAPLGHPVHATVEGVLVTTFLFDALETTPSTEVGFIEEWGSDPVYYTRVIDGEIPGLDITGALIATTVEIVPPCPGDLNDDRVVNTADLLFLLGEWGAPDSPADIDEDGDVDTADLLILLAAWGACP